MKYIHNAIAIGKRTDFVHFIPYVNCPELLEKAASSTINNAKQGIGIIIDNRSDLSLPSAMQVITGKEIENHFIVMEPDVPLTTAQVMNLMLKTAIELGVPFFTWMHGDGEVVADCLELINIVRQNIETGEKWGGIFTRYDVYCAFNVQACKEIGVWDWLRFPYYFLDNDYYYRLKAAGYRCITIEELKPGVIHHNDASNTIKNDPLRKMLNDNLFPVQEKLFKEKYPQGTKIDSGK